jgi:hypothetical protein
MNDAPAGRMPVLAAHPASEAPTIPISTPRISSLPFWEKIAHSDKLGEQSFLGVVKNGSGCCGIAPEGYRFAKPRQYRRDFGRVTGAKTCPRSISPHTARRKLSRFFGEAVEAGVSTMSALRPERWREPIGNTSGTAATEFATELGSTGADGTGRRTFRDLEKRDNPPLLGTTRDALGLPRTNHI